MPDPGEINMIIRTKKNIIGLNTDSELFPYKDIERTGEDEDDP